MKKSRGPFVRYPFGATRSSYETRPTTGIEACAYRYGDNCFFAFRGESDPIKRRYMIRLADAGARGWYESRETGERPDIEDLELGMQQNSICHDDGPCGRRDPNDDMHSFDTAYGCLVKAEEARRNKNGAASRAAHARACRCDSDNARIPVDGGFLACDGRDKLVERGKSFTLEEATDVNNCGACDQKRGPIACANEVRRLASTDPDLAKYIENVHVPRCRQP